MYDGTVIDRPDTCALGGDLTPLDRLSNGFAEGFSLVDAIRLGVRHYQATVDRFPQIHWRSPFSNAMAIGALSSPRSQRIEAALQE